MATLLDEAIDAHGGVDRWKALRALRATASLAGPFWDIRAVPAELCTGVTVDAQMHEQLVSLSRWTDVEHRFVLSTRPEIATLTAVDLHDMEIRRDPRASFPAEAGAAAHYVDDYVDVDGLKFPTRRWVYPRQPDNTADRQTFTGSRGSLIDVTIGDIVLRAANS